MLFFQYRSVKVNDFVCSLLLRLFLQKDSEGAECSTTVSVPSAEEDEQKDGDKDSKKKKNRCAVCRKKVGLTGT